MLEIPKLMSELSNERPAFHSEADFQHALAWEIHQMWQKSKVRLEYKPQFFDSRAYVDVWAVIGNNGYAIELKYKTRGLRFDAGGETFDLLDQSAQDLGRYDFLKDIQRLERITSRTDTLTGYAILLTNDPSYWNKSRDDGTIDAHFRIQDGRVLTGTLGWSHGASEGTKRDRQDPIRLQGTYKLEWGDYSEPVRATYGKFRYLVIEVRSRVPRANRGAGK